MSFWHLVILINVFYLIVGPTPIKVKFEDVTKGDKTHLNRPDYLGILPIKLPLNLTFALEWLKFKYFPQSFLYDIIGPCNITWIVLCDILGPCDNAHITLCDILEPCDIAHITLCDILEPCDITLLLLRIAVWKIFKLRLF